MTNVSIAVIGGGPAGLAAAVAAFDAGARDIVVFERDTRLGGILGQCIHNGFGLHRFREELTGPEYADRYVREAEKRGIRCYTGTMVTEINSDKVITATNSELGIFAVKADAVILAMGCRERSRGALNTPGTRPSGVYTAGTAQKYVNIMGYMPGRKVVILGSGDIGLIMARRMTLEGAEVVGVFEIMPYSGGLKRNIVQCLDDFGIPLYLSTTITEFHGDTRVTGVTVAEVDENRSPVSGTERFIECDTVLLSVGLIPENELTKGMGIRLARGTGGAEVDENRQTDIPGVFACGNVLHVHDLVDFVSEEAEIAGRAAADYVKGKRGGGGFSVTAGENVSYVVPQRICKDAENVKLMFRVKREMRDVTVTCSSGGRVLLERKKKKVAPGEMENLSLKGIAGDVTVAVREDR